MNPQRRSASAPADGRDLTALACELASVASVGRDVDSGPLTTYRVGGPIAVLVDVDSRATLGEVSRKLAGWSGEIVVIGRGSNLLVADTGFDGVAIRLGSAFEQIEVLEPIAVPEPDGIGRPRATNAIDATAQVRAGGATALPVLARQSAQLGLRGLEFYVGIPGSVGGAIRMNAGGHGAETVDVLETATLLTLGRDEAVERSAAELGLAFRHSDVGDRDVVVSATFRVERGARDAARAEIDEIVRWRRANQPGGQNCGSVFVNPVGDSAGRLIDAAGLKGARIGGAAVSAKHANFVQADPGALAADVVALIASVRAVVRERSGITLRPELRLLGFDPSALAGDGDPPAGANQVRA